MRTAEYAFLAVVVALAVAIAAYMVVGPIAKALADANTFEASAQ